MLILFNSKEHPRLKGEYMAKVQDNIFVRGLSGSLGDFVIRHMADGSTRVCKKPDFSRRVFSNEQKDHQSRFRQAVGYARDAAKMYPIYAELAKGTTKNAYNWALSDWFNPPVIQRIERQEGQIRVQACDNVMVTKVEVRVINENGEILEAGEASQVDPMWWEFPSTVEGTVVAIAWDLAENKTKAIL
jgi:hypothetical protein